MKTASLSLTALPQHDRRHIPATNGVLSSQADELGQAGRATQPCPDCKEARPVFLSPVVVAFAWFVFHAFVVFTFVGLFALRVSQRWAAFRYNLSVRWFHLTKTVICCWCKKTLRRPRLPFVTPNERNTTGTICPACMAKHVVDSLQQNTFTR